MALERVADSLLGDVPDLEHQRSYFVERPTRDDRNDKRQDVNPRTYSDRLVLSPGGEKLAIWTKAYAPDVQIVCVVCRFIDQDAVQQ